MTDTLVKCDRCGSQPRVAFAKGLAGGWPECCGETMRLVRTNADVGATADERFRRHRSRVDSLREIIGGPGA